MCVAGWATACEARPLRVVTSFPPSMIEVYRKGFQSAHPDIEVEFVQRKTTAAVAQLAGGDRLDADLFWASAPDAFELLKLEGRLSPLAPRTTGAPATVAGYPVNDPDGHYLGFALSAYGLAVNEAYLARHRLPVPRGWRDLTAPVYAGHVGVSSPSRSGTTHLVVEALLQSEGWEPGWRTWRQIGGNLATVTARSFGVSAGVARGRFGIGVTIDFLAQPTGLDADPVRFTAPDPEIFAPASIALLREARNPEAADAFVDFLLSVPGQLLLLDPTVGRQPIRPEFYAEGRIEGPNPFQTAESGDGWRFDAGRSAARYELINLMFDELVTLRLAETAAIWRTVNEVEASLTLAPDETAAKAATQARSLLGAVPFGEEEASRIVEATKLARVPRGLQPPEAQARLMARLRDWIGDNLAAARQAAETARARLVSLGRLPEPATGSASP
nr:extracellular solute-binding protein [Ancylobacter koreensis]